MRIQTEDKLRLDSIAEQQMREEKILADRDLERYKRTHRNLFCGECNLNSVWFLFLLNHNKYNFFFLDLQMLLKVVFGCVQGRRRMSRLYTLAHIRELPFLCV